MWKSAEDVTVPKLLKAAVQNWPTATFLDFSGAKYTFSETEREVMKLARGFRRMGIAKGDRVASLLDNVPETAIIWFALNQIGAIYVPINTEYRGEYLRHQLHDSGSVLIVCGAQYVQRVQDVASELPSLRTIAAVGASGDSEVTPVISLDDLRLDGSDPVEEDVRPTDISTLIYTSGTTGRSKGCMVGHSYAYNFALQNQWHARVAPGDVLWTPAPMFHTTAAFGIVLNALISGATASIYTKFSVSNFWPEIERSGATHVCMLSIMLTLVPSAPESEAAKRCYGQIKVLFGSPLPDTLKAIWKEKFGVQRASSPGYGMTEACMVTLTSSYDDNVAPNSSGRRHDDFDVRIVDEQGNECPPGKPGEVILRPRRGGIMFQGYWGQPAATSAAIRDCWFHTGDIGMFDERDFFYFVDRKKDCLRRGGENISSYEVEAAFRPHPAIAEIAAHAVPSDLAEDDLKVTIVLRDGETVTPDELYQWAVDRVPRFALPRYIEFRASFPTTPSGKVQKQVLRDEGVTRSTWDRGPIRRANSRH